MFQPPGYTEEEILLGTRTDDTYPWWLVVGARCSVLDAYVESCTQTLAGPQGSFIPDPKPHIPSPVVNEYLLQQIHNLTSGNMPRDIPPEWVGGWTIKMADAWHGIR